MSGAPEGFRRRRTLGQTEFTTIPNHWLRTPRLTNKERGLLCAIVSHDPDYPLTVEQLTAQCGDGKDAIRTGLANLERVRGRHPDGRLGKYLWDVVEDPHGEGPQRISRSGSDQPVQDKPAGQNQSGFPAPGNPPLRRLREEDQEEEGAPRGLDAARTDDRPAEPEPGPTAKRLVTEWVAAQPQRPPRALTGQIARYVGDMIREGIHPDHIRFAFYTLGQKSLHPSTLPSLVHGAQSIPPADCAAFVTAMARDAATG